MAIAARDPVRAWVATRFHRSTAPRLRAIRLTALSFDKTAMGEDPPSPDERRLSSGRAEASKVAREWYARVRPKRDVGASAPRTVASSTTSTLASVKNNLFPGTALAYLVGTDAIHRLWRNLAGRRASSSAPSTIACSRTARSRWLSRRRPCARSRRASRARSGSWLWLFQLRCRHTSRRLPFTLGAWERSLLSCLRDCAQMWPCGRTPWRQQRSRGEGAALYARNDPDQNPAVSAFGWSRLSSSRS